MKHTRTDARTGRAVQTPREINERPMIGLRVTVEEMETCRHYAQQQVRSVASFARMLMLRGLAQFEEEQRRHSETR